MRCAFATVVLSLAIAAALAIETPVEAQDKAAGNKSLRRLEFEWKAAFYTNSGFVGPEDDPRHRKDFDKGVVAATKAIRDAYRQEGKVFLPAVRPLVVGDTVLARTAVKLVAIEFRTGRRRWYAAEDLAMVHLLRYESARREPRRFPEIEEHHPALHHRLGFNATYGTISTDGKLVFCVEELDVLAPMYKRLLRDQLFPREPTPKAFNTVCGYGLVAEGCLMWALGGPKDGTTRLSGTYFLGTPTPVADRLYVLGERDGDVMLFGLKQSKRKNPRGRIRHHVAVEKSSKLFTPQDDISKDLLRRYAGLSPVHHGGLLLCPTAAGRVIAVDAKTRAVRWTYPYKADNRQACEFPRRYDLEPITLNRWMGTTITLSGDRALLTPPESDQLHCVSLKDGKAVWTAPRAGTLYLAGVHDGTAILVGTNEIRAVRIEDGKAAPWPANPLPLPKGDRIGGWGFLHAGQYVLPLASGEMLAIDVAKGRIVGRVRADKDAIERKPQNLIRWKGSVLSQTVDTVGRFTAN